MALLDIFGADAFDVVSLTKSVNRLPVAPGKIKAMRLFTPKGQPTTRVALEEQNGKISLVPTSPRGTAGTPHGSLKRKMRYIDAVRIAKTATVMADDVQGVRAFGSEDQVETVNDKIAEKQTEMKADIFTTFEHMYACAIQGIVYDSDGSTEILDLYDFFDVAAPAAVDFVLGTSSKNIKGVVTSIVRKIEDACTGLPIQSIHCLCGETFFDKFIAHAEVKTAFDYANERSFFAEDQRKGFRYNGVVFEEYRAQVGSRRFIAPGDARFFPVAAGAYEHVMCPADYMETVNTVGQELYSKSAAMEMDRGIKLEVQANLVPYCTVPLALIRGYSSN